MRRAAISCNFAIIAPYISSIFIVIFLSLSVESRQSGFSALPLFHAGKLPSTAGRYPDRHSFSRSDTFRPFFFRHDRRNQQNARLQRLTVRRHVHPVGKQAHMPAQHFQRPVGRRRLEHHAFHFHRFGGAFPGILDNRHDFHRFASHADIAQFPQIPDHLVRGQFHSFLPSFHGVYHRLFHVFPGQQPAGMLARPGRRVSGANRRLRGIQIDEILIDKAALPGGQGGPVLPFFRHALYIAPVPVQRFFTFHQPVSPSFSAICLRHPCAASRISCPSSPDMPAACRRHTGQKPACFFRRETKRATIRSPYSPSAPIPSSPAISRAATVMPSPFFSISQRISPLTEPLRRPISASSRSATDSPALPASPLCRKTGRGCRKDTPYKRFSQNTPSFPSPSTRFPVSSPSVPNGRFRTDRRNGHPIPLSAREIRTVWRHAFFNDFSLSIPGAVSRNPFHRKSGMPADEKRKHPFFSARFPFFRLFTSLAGNPRTIPGTRSRLQAHFVHTAHDPFGTGHPRIVRDLAGRHGRTSQRLRHHGRFRCRQRQIVIKIFHMLGPHGSRHIGHEIVRPARCEHVLENFLHLQGMIRFRRIRLEAGSHRFHEIGDIGEKLDGTPSLFGFCPGPFAGGALGPFQIGQTQRMFHFQLPAFHGLPDLRYIGKQIDSRFRNTQTAAEGFSFMIQYIQRTMHQMRIAAGDQLSVMQGSGDIPHIHAGVRKHLSETSDGRFIILKSRFRIAARRNDRTDTFAASFRTRVFHQFFFRLFQRIRLAFATGNAFPGNSRIRRFPLPGKCIVFSGNGQFFNQLLHGRRIARPGFLHHIDPLAHTGGTLRFPCGDRTVFRHIPIGHAGNRPILFTCFSVFHSDSFFPVFCFDRHYRRNTIPFIRPGNLSFPASIPFFFRGRAVLALFWRVIPRPATSASPAFGQQFFHHRHNRFQKFLSGSPRNGHSFSGYRRRQSRFRFRPRHPRHFGRRLSRFPFQPLVPCRRQILRGNRRQSFMPACRRHPDIAGFCRRQFPRKSAAISGRIVRQFRPAASHIRLRHRAGSIAVI
nr:MAG TPA: hypothetical protein [Caudoviricetes sp.]